MLRRFFLAIVGVLMAAGSLSAQTPTEEPVPATSPAAAESPDSPTPMQDPQTGDHWTYEFRDEITGEVKSTFTQTITDITPAEINIRNAVLGSANFGFQSYDHSWNRTVNDVWRFTPNDGTGIRLPLAVGKTWSAKANDTNTSAGASFKRSTVSKVVGQESVTTRAGTFDTYEIEISGQYQNTKDPTKKYQEVIQTWYAPVIDHWVKQSVVTRSDGRVRSKTVQELVEYGRR